MREIARTGRIDAEIHAPPSAAIVPPRWRKRAFTLVELLAVIAIIGVLVALLLPAVQAARESARRTTCQNRLRQLAIGVLVHENTMNRFPNSGAHGFQNWSSTARSHAFWGFWSFLIAVLPNIEEQSLYDDYMGIIQKLSGAIGPNHSTNSTTAVPGRSPRTIGEVVGQVLPQLRCPSDPSISWLNPPTAAQGRSVNFLASMGDVLDSVPTGRKRGPFWYNAGGAGGTSSCRIKDITDGVSKTVMLAEGCTGILRDAKTAVFRADSWPSNTRPINCLNTRTLSLTSSSALQESTAGFDNYIVPGSRMQDARYVGFYTVLPPNSPACASGSVWYGFWERMPAPVGSWHSGAGASVAMCDGSVRFVTETIDTGNLNQNQTNPNTGPSQWGLWGAMGSINGGESLATSP